MRNAVLSLIVLFFSSGFVYAGFGTITEDSTYPRIVKPGGISKDKGVSDPTEPGTGGTDVGSSMFHVQFIDGVSQYAPGFNPLNDVFVGMDNMVKHHKELENKGGNVAKKRKKFKGRRSTGTKSQTTFEHLTDVADKVADSAVKIETEKEKTKRDKARLDAVERMQKNLQPGQKLIYEKYDGESYEIRILNESDEGRTFDGEYAFINPGRFISDDGMGINPWTQMFAGGYDDILSGDSYITSDSHTNTHRNKFGIPTFNGASFLDDSFFHTQQYGRFSREIGVLIGALPDPLNMTIGELSDYFESIDYPVTMGNLLNDPIMGRGFSGRSIIGFFDPDLLQDAINSGNMTVGDKLTLLLTLTESTLAHLSNTDTIFDVVLLSDFLNSSFANHDFLMTKIGYFANGELLRALEDHAEYAKLENREKVTMKIVHPDAYNKVTGCKGADCFKPAF